MAVFGGPWARLMGDLDRKGFWIRFGGHLILAIALTALWVVLAEVWLDQRPLLVIVPIRLLLVGPQLSIYVRRLRDAGRSGWWALWLVALYAVGLAAFVHYAHRLDGWGQQLASLRRYPPDESTADVQAHYDNDLETVLVVGAGALTGLPGPLQLAFASVVGRLTPLPRQ